MHAVPQSSLWAIAILVLSMTPAWAQPFTTVLNIPPDPDVGNYLDIDSNTQINLFDGGSIGSGIDAGAPDGTSSSIEVNVFGGQIGSNFRARGGSAVRIAGGRIGDGLSANPGSTLHLAGGDFRLNGTPISGLDTIGTIVPFDIPDGSVLSGVFSDGTPFAFSNFDWDHISAGTLTLQRTALPAVGPPLISLPSDPVPNGLRGGQTLIINDGGDVGNNFNAGQGSVVRINGGRVANFEAVGAQIDISGGLVLIGFDAFNGTTVEMSGGTASGRFDAFSGSVVNLSGGQIGGIGIPGIKTFSGSEFNVHGGDFRLDGAPIGGLESIGERLSLDIPRGSTLSGTLADGTPFVFQSIYDRPPSFPTFMEHEIADGTLSIVRAEVPVVVPEVITVDDQTVRASIRDGQQLILTDGGSLPNGFTAGWGSRLDINGGEIPGRLQVVGSHVTITGGSISTGIGAYQDSVVDIYGGELGYLVQSNNGSVVNFRGDIESHVEFDVNSGGTVNHLGGNLLGRFYLNDGGVMNIAADLPFGAQFVSRPGSVLNVVNGDDIVLSVNSQFAPAIGGDINFLGGNVTRMVGGSSTEFRGTILGGRIGDGFGFGRNSEFNIAGGAIGDTMYAPTIVNMSGGTVGDGFHVFHGGTLNLFGTSFVLDGVDITATLNPDVPFTIDTRDVALSGLLVDGSAFSFDLNSEDRSGEDHFHRNATLTVTLVTRLLGDYNNDGIVNRHDENAWHDMLGQNVIPGTGADGNFNGVVDDIDRLIWENAFANAPIPEPATWLMLLAMAAGYQVARIRR